MAKQTKNKNEKMNPFLWFLIVIIIPILFALILAYIVFSMAGVNVTNWMKDKASTVPVVSSLITTDEEKNSEQRNEKFKTALDNKDAEIESLTQEIMDLEGTIEKLERDLLKSEKRNTDNAENETEPEDEVITVKKMSGSFKDMDPEQAALIIQRLDKDIAVSILKSMSNKVRGSILEVMDPEQAAELTEEIID